MNRNDYEENEQLKAQLAGMAEIPDSIMSMSLDQLRAEQDRVAASYGKTGGRHLPRHRDADLVQAHSEILSNRTRHAQPKHPIAEQLLAGGSHPSLVDMARNWAANRHGPEAMAWGDHEVLAHASTAHLSEVLSNHANSIVLSRSPELQRIPIRLSRAVALNDYKPMSIGAVTLDAGVPEPKSVLDEWASIVPSATAGELQAKLAPLRIRFSEILVTNDDTESMARTIESALLAASQNETRMFTRLLTDNGNLPDGSAWFGASNSVLGANANTSSLAAGMAKLRAQSVNGKPSDFRAAFWLVPSSEEFSALEAVHAVSVDRPLVEVIPTAHLPEGTGGFLFANPAAWPAVVRGTLRGSNGVSLRFAPGNPTESESHRDAIVEGLHTVSYAPVSRLGVVRIAPAE